MVALLRRPWPLRLWLFAVIAPLMAALPVALLLVYDREARRLVLDDATREFQQLGQQAIEALDRAQEPARAWLQAATASPDPRRFDDEDLAFTRSFLAVQALYPQLGSLYFGMPNGSFIRLLPLRPESPERQVVRPPTNAAFAEQLNRGGGLDDRWRFFDDQFNLLSSEDRPHAGYDPRARAWYRNALRQPGQVVITEPYVYAVTSELGITLSRTVRGAPAMVAGADLALSDISRFLASRLGTTDVEMLLFDATGAVWASNKLPRMRELLASKEAPSLAVYGGSDYAKLLDLASSAPDLAKQAQRPQTLRGANGVSYLAIVGVATQVLGVPVFVAVLAPEQRVFGGVDRLRRWALSLSLAAVAVAALMAWWAARRLAKPLKDLAIEARRFSRFEFDLPDPLAMPPPTRIREVDQLRESLDLARLGLAGYARYVPRPLVQHLLSNRVEPKPSAIERDITMLIATAEDVLRIMRTFSAKRLVERTEEYLQGITDAITAHNGTIDKFHGDALVAFFNAPVQSSRHPAQACDAALAAREQFAAAAELAQSQGDTPIQVRFVIHTGVAVVGNFGTTERLNYTAVGPAPSLASRLLRFNRRYRAEIVVTDSVKLHVERSHVLRWLDKVEVHGLDRALDLYELLAARNTSEDSLRAQALAQLCEDARLAYAARDWPKAHRAYLELAQERPYDAYVKIMAARTLFFINDPPPPEWDMVERERPIAPVLLA